VSTLTIAPFDFPADLLKVASLAYAHPRRAYHHFGHARAVLGLVATVPDLQHPRETALAALFHDAIYVAGRSDNEAQSADLAVATIPQHLTNVDLDRVRHLIMLTARHGKLTPADLDPDAAHFVDCDMAIIGAPEADFDVYDAAIAEEYAGVVPAVLYRFNRRRFLKHLLDADRIYFSPRFHALYDAPARANLSRVLAS
jgi:predicted metal-dependent HD superfamily phosphohydrolase